MVCLSLSPAFVSPSITPSFIPLSPSSLVFPPHLCTVTASCFCFSFNRVYATLLSFPLSLSAAAHKHTYPHTCLPPSFYCLIFTTTRITIVTPLVMSLTVQTGSLTSWMDWQRDCLIWMLYICMYRYLRSSSRAFSRFGVGCMIMMLFSCLYEAQFKVGLTGWSASPVLWIHILYMYSELLIYQKQLLTLHSRSFIWFCFTVFVWKLQCLVQILLVAYISPQEQTLVYRPELLLNPLSSAHLLVAW